MMGNKQIQTAFRLPEELIKRIDHEVKKKRKAYPGLRWNRSAIIRERLLKSFGMSPE